MEKMKRVYERGGRRVFLLLCCVFLLLCGGPAGAEDSAAPAVAEDRTALCGFETNGRSQEFELMTDGDLSTYFPFKEKKGTLTITASAPIQGISVMLFDKYGKPLSYDVQVPGEGDAWVTVAQSGAYLVNWHALAEPVERIRLVATCTERLRIAELRLFGPGQRPAEIQEWSSLEKCDLMLLSAHPDDEILWFGGLLPTYAGERKYRVQVVVLAPTGGMRKLELLSAIWHCGVHDYPELLGFIDKNGKTAEKQYTLWRGKNRVLGRVVGVIRKHQPEVLVTHGEGGEYGHGAHKLAADAAKNAVKLAAKSGKYKESVKLYGTWQVKKLYLHEYKKNQIVCDWTVPLQAFVGKTGYEVAEEAFAFHASQVKRDWSFEVHGSHDNALFGLYQTEVGQDTGIGDLMEHITET